MNEKPKGDVMTTINEQILNDALEYYKGILKDLYRPGDDSREAHRIAKSETYKRFPVVKVWAKSTGPGNRNVSPHHRSLMGSFYASMKHAIAALTAPSSNGRHEITADGCWMVKHKNGSISLRASVMNYWLTHIKPHGVGFPWSASVGLFTESHGLSPQAFYSAFYKNGGLADMGFEFEIESFNKRRDAIITCTHMPPDPEPEPEPDPGPEPDPIMTKIAELEAMIAKLKDDLS